MSWSYDPSLAAAKDQIRFYASDTVSGQPITVSDEEIAGALLLGGGARAAAALVCENLAGRYAQAASSITDDIGQSVSYADRAAFYERRAAQLRSRISLGAIPFAGGISLADKQAQELDQDRVVPSFTASLHNAPGTGAAAEEER